MGYYLQTSQNHNKAFDIISSVPDSVAIPKPKSFSDIPQGMALVVVVDNMIFEAAGIAFNEAEFQEFTKPTDTRPKEYVLVPVDVVIKVHPELEKYYQP